MNELSVQKKEVAYYMRRLYKKNLTTSLGGNISVKYGNKILISPSGLDKAKLKKEQIVILDENAKNLTPGLKPSIEYNFHTAIYEKFNNINAIIHAHPPMATIFSARKKTINTKLLAESRYNLSQPIKVPYFRQGSIELANAIVQSIYGSHVLLMQNHGVLTIGKNLLEAFERIESLENAAKATIITELFNDKIELPENEIAYFDNLFNNNLINK